MNTKLLLIIIFFAGASSCTTAYKSGQTPDDVYYSPAIPQNDYVSVESDDDRSSYNSSAEDHEIRRGINNRRWREYNDIDYSYPSPYVYNYQYYPQYYYPYSYSYYPPIYVNPQTGKSPLVYTAPRKFNLNTYGNNTPKNNTLTYRPALITGDQKTTTTPVITTNKSRGVGNFVRRVLSSSSTNTDYNTPNNSIDNRNYQPARSTPASITPSSSSSSSSSGGNVPVRTFHK